MHDNFYHWHEHAELKPEVSILKPRWDAATSATKKLSAADLCAALQLALVPKTQNTFSAQFSVALVKLEPTFPPIKNTELLRVMATAGLYQHMEESSVHADAIALGIRAGSRCAGAQPVCPELVPKAEEYLNEEAENVRGDTSNREDFEELRTLTSKADWHAEDDAVTKVGAAVIALGGILDQLSEENQFLWWLNVQRSSTLNVRRPSLKPKDYALVAAKEAAERVKLIPPPVSAVSLLEEVLSQCAKGADTTCLIEDMLKAQGAHTLVFSAKASSARLLCPLTNALMHLSKGMPFDKNWLVPLGGDEKATPTALAKRFFDELMFLKALELIS